MGAPFKVLDDSSALGGDRIDVAVRVGWALRMARLVTGGRAASGLADMVEMLEERGVDVSVSTLHRVESGRVRLGHVASAYETVLELPAGALRAPGDILCRTFPYSPTDKGDDRLPQAVEEMDALLGSVDHPDATGGDWLSWARGVAGVGGLGVPSTLLRPLVERLVSELGRSAGTAYHARYEALALLRCSAYGSLVLEVARDVVADPHVQVLNDLLSLVGEAVTDEARDWAAGLLLDERDRVSFAASLCLENMLEVGGDAAVLSAVAPVVVEALNGCAADSERRTWLSHLVRLMTSAERARVRRLVERPLSPTVRMPDWTRTSLNDHWALCDELGRRATAGLGLPDQPLLTRLLFEVAMGPHESRAVTSYMLLRGIPGIGDRGCDVVAELADTHPDPLVRERAARRVVGLVADRQPKQAGSWQSTGHERLGAGLLLAGSSGTPLATELLRSALADPTTRRTALYAAGMTGSPLLAELVAGPDAEARDAAAWWVAHGGRVTV